MRGGFFTKFASLAHCVAHTRLTSTKKFTNVLLESSRHQGKKGDYEENKKCLRSDSNFISYNFLECEGLQGTHMDELNPFHSKLMTLTLREDL